MPARKQSTKDAAQPTPTPAERIAPTAPTAPTAAELFDMLYKVSEDYLKSFQSIKRQIISARAGTAPQQTNAPRCYTEQEVYDVVSTLFGRLLQQVDVTAVHSAGYGYTAGWCHCRERVVTRLKNLLLDMPNLLEQGATKDDNANASAPSASAPGVYPTGGTTYSTSNTSNTSTTSTTSSAPSISADG